MLVFYFYPKMDWARKKLKFFLRKLFFAEEEVLSTCKCGHYNKMDDDFCHIVCLWIQQKIRFTAYLLEKWNFFEIQMRLDVCAE